MAEEVTVNGGIDNISDSQIESQAENQRPSAENEANGEWTMIEENNTMAIDFKEEDFDLILNEFVSLFYLWDVSLRGYTHFMPFAFQTF